MRAVLAATSADLQENMTEDELNMTVEEYLRAQCERKVQQLKRHMETLIERFDGEAKRARTQLREIATGNADAATSAGGSSTDVDAFALVAIRGMHAGKIFVLQPNEVQTKWTIGREEGNDFCLAGDPEVSSNHAEVSYAGKQFKLMDVGSTNGTYASTGLSAAAKLKRKKNHVLKLDHLITFGSCTFKWCYHSDALSLANSLKEAAATVN